MIRLDEDGDRFNALYVEQGELADRAYHIGRQVIRSHLQRLEDRFPRHRFRYVDGMGTMSVYCSPAILGDRFGGTDETTLNSMGTRLAHRAPAFAADLFDFIESEVEAITDMACQIGDDFRIDFDEVTTDNDDEDCPD